MNKTSSSVLTVGGAMIDTIALIDSDRIERMIMNNADKAFLLLEEGRKTEASLISTHPGGGGINSAVCFARLGFDTAALLKLGCDARGESIRQAMRQDGVSDRYAVECEFASTGASVHISSHVRDAAIFTYRGANSFLTSTDINAQSLRADIVYISGLSDGSAEIFPELVQAAHANGAFIAVNPGIRQLAARGPELGAVLPQLSVLCLNRQEACALVPYLFRASKDIEIPRGTRDSLPDLMYRGLSASGYDMSLPRFFDALLTVGVSCVVITDGRNGAYAAVRGEMFHCESIATEVVGTAGAGDAFSSTFTAFLATGSSLPEALEYATLNARSVVMHADTLTGLLGRDELETCRGVSKNHLNVSSWPLG